MERIGKYTVIGFTACLLAIFAYLTDSEYLTGFFAENAILLGIAVFSIHAASSAILISQLAILGKSLHIDFSPTCKSIHYSFIEALIWLVGIMICAIFAQSIYIDRLLYSKLWIPAILLFCVISLLFIVYDVVKAITLCFHSPSS